AAPQKRPGLACALQHRLAARRALVLGFHRRRPRLLALSRLDVLAPLLEARAADELASRLLAVIDHQRPAAQRARLARLLAALGRHLLLGRPQRRRKRPPE